MQQAQKANDDFLAISINHKGKAEEYEQENPFKEVDDQVMAEMGYVYKIWNIGSKNICVRCTRQTYKPNSWDTLSEEEVKERKEAGYKAPARQYMNVHTFLESDFTKGNEWKTTLAT